MTSSRVNEHLLIQTAFLGDLALSIPLLKKMREIDPSAKITLLCRKGLGDWLSKLKLVDECVEVDKENGRGWAEARAVLRERRFSLLVCPHESFRSALFARKMSAEKKIGFKRFFSFLAFDHQVVRPMHLPEALRQLSLLTPVDPLLAERLLEFANRQTADGGQAQNGFVAVPSWAEMKISITQKSMSIAERWSKINLNNLVVIAPGSVWSTKMWTAEGFATVASRLAIEGSQIVLIGSKSEDEICRRIVEQVETKLASATEAKLVNLAGKTSLTETLQILAIAKLLVCNDSGAMHLGAVADTPTVAVFGPTILEFGYRPWQNRAIVVQSPPLACRPCGAHGAKVCPIGTHECMRSIQPDEVMHAISRLSERGHSLS